MDSRERTTEPACWRESHGQPCQATIGADASTGEPFLPITYLSLYTEKKQDRGEDADPLSESVGPDACVVGVFDGLGGAGATPIETAQGARTSAFIAARLAREGTQTVLSEALNPQTPPPASGGPDGLSHERLETLLATHLRERFGRYLAQTGAPESRIRSALIRPLPTTLAVAVLTARPDRISVRVLWAGDSRVYMLLPHTGLHQLSIDDLKSRGDAMRNLEDDSPLSNLVSADGRFQINVHSFSNVPDRAVILAATDGCFGYLPTPAHFEEALLTTMAEAAGTGDWRQWQACLRSRITGITGDDATLGMACLGWDSFAAMAESFAPRLAAVSTLTSAVDDADTRRAAAVAKADDAKAAHAAAKAEMWDFYRDGYEKFLRMAEEQKKPKPATVPEPPGLDPAVIAGPGPGPGGTASNCPDTTPPLTAPAMESAAPERSGYHDGATADDAVVPLDDLTQVAHATSEKSPLAESPARVATPRPAGGDPERMGHEDRRELEGIRPHPALQQYGRRPE